MISERVRRVHEALGTEVSYSVKANPSLGVCQLIASQQEAGAEVASSGELAVARAAGFEPEDIVFAGPGKTDDELRRAVDEGIFAVNVESLGEIDRLAGIAGEAGKTIGVGLRINPEAQLMGSQACAWAARSASSAWTRPSSGRPCGRRYPTRSSPCAACTSTRRPRSSRSSRSWSTAATSWRSRFRRRTSPAIRWRWSTSAAASASPTSRRRRSSTWTPSREGFRELLASYRQDPRLAGCRFLFELGRYLVADAGVYVTRAVDVKETRGKTFVVTDGGMNHHLTATGNMGQVFRKAYPLLNLTRMEAVPGEEGVAVAGPCCTPLDMFGNNIPLADPEVGDLIGVFYSGAYGYSASNLGFLSHPSPAEVLLWHGEAHLLRPGGRPEDVLKGQEALSKPGVRG